MKPGAPLMATNEEGKKRLHSLLEREYEVLVFSQGPIRQTHRPSLGQAPSEEDNRPVPLCRYERGRRSFPDSYAGDTTTCDHADSREPDDAGRHADHPQITLR